MENPAASSKPASWRIIAASVRGSSHEKKNQPCQDAVRWQSLPGDVWIAAVADGAGSAALAEAGSTAACAASLDFLGRKLREALVPATEEKWRQLLADSLQAARQALVAEAAARQAPLRDLATTLLLLAVTPEAVAGAQVGDGAALVADSAGNLLALTRPCLNEYLNETTFLTSESALENPQLQFRPGRIKHAALLSDGLQMLALKMPEGAPHYPFFAPLFRFLEAAGDPVAARDQLAAFLLSPRIQQRANDDLTLLLAGRIPASG